MKFNKTELKRRLSDIQRKGITNQQMKDLIDSLWRDSSNYSHRTSGFVFAGGTDSEMGVEYIDSPGSGSGSGEWSGSGEPDSLLSPWFWIQPTTTHFSFYQFITTLSLHTRDEKEWIELPDEEGMYMIYYEEDSISGSQTLKYIQNPTRDEEQTAYTEQVIVAFVYWNATSHTCMYLGDERHGSEWNPQINWWASRALGGLIESGLALTNIPEAGEDETTGSSNSDAQMGIESGIWHHEDITVVQNAILYTVGFPVMYFLAEKIRISNTGFPVLVSSGAAQYNYQGSSLRAIDNGFYFMTHIFVTNCQLYPVVAVMGRTTKEVLDHIYSAYEEEIKTIKDAMVVKCWAHIGTVFYQAYSGYPNAAKSRIVGAYDMASVMAKIADEKMPFVKVGWMPDVWSYVSWTDLGTSLYVASTSLQTHYFWEGKKKMMFAAFSFNYAHVYGKQYCFIINNAAGVSTTPWNNADNDRIMVAVINYNEIDASLLYAGFEMHSASLEPSTRGTNHQTEFCTWVSGLEITDNGDNTISLSVGELHDEDIVASVGGSGVFWAQSIAPLSASKYYLKTTDGVTRWHIDKSNNGNIALIGGSKIFANIKTGTEWDLEEVEIGKFVAMWLIGTMDAFEPLKWITGTTISDTKEEAEIANDSGSFGELLSEIDFFAEEYTLTPIARIIIESVSAEPYYQTKKVDDTRTKKFDQIQSDWSETDSTKPSYIRNKSIETDKSVEGDGSIDDPIVLENDRFFPGPWKVYSTNADGVKGWWSIGGGDSAGSGSGSSSESDSGSGSSDESSPWLDHYVDEVTLEADNDGAPPSVDNTNNTVKLTLQRNGTLPDLSVIFGSMAALKAWNGDADDLPESRNNDTVYFVNEEE